MNSIETFIEKILKSAIQINNGLFSGSEDFSSCSNFATISVVEASNKDKDEVDNPPDTGTTSGDEFDDSPDEITHEESVETEISDETGDKEEHQITEGSFACTTGSGVNDDNDDSGITITTISGDRDFSIVLSGSLYCR